MWQYVVLWRKVRDVHLGVVPDAILWRWTYGDQFSSKSSATWSCLRDSRVQALESLMSKSWVSPRVKFFILLSCQDRCSMVDRFARRDVQHTPTKRSLRPEQGDYGAPPHRLLLLLVDHARVLDWIRSTAAPYDIETISWIGGNTLIGPQTCSERHNTVSHAYDLMAGSIPIRSSSMSCDSTSNGSSPLFRRKPVMWQWRGKGVAELPPTGPSSYRRRVVISGVALS